MTYMVTYVRRQSKTLTCDLSACPRSAFGSRLVARGLAQVIA